MKRCDCMPPPPPPKKGPSEYIPSRTYPDPFINMVPGYVPMHRAGCFGPFIPVCPCPPPPPPPKPEPRPSWGCPPKVYRNPPDVIVEGGEHITVDEHTEDDNTATTYTVNSVQWPVVIDSASDEVLYGDGTPENPLGIYDFVGATENEDGKPGTVPAPAIDERDSFLKGDGTWSPIVVPEQSQSDWAVNDSSDPAYIRNRPDIPEMIAVETERAETAEAAETERALAAEAAATTEVRAGENASVTSATAADGHTVYTVNADGKPQEQADWAQDDSTKVDYIKNRPGVFSGATAQSNGASGFVPAPLVADREKFLRGDGSWSVVDNTRECTAQEMDSWLNEVENNG